MVVIEAKINNLNIVIPWQELVCNHILTLSGFFMHKSDSVDSPMQVGNTL